MIRQATYPTWFRQPCCPKPRRPSAPRRRRLGSSCSGPGLHQARPAWQALASWLRRRGAPSRGRRYDASPGLGDSAAAVSTKAEAALAWVKREQWADVGSTSVGVKGRSVRRRSITERRVGASLRRRPPRAPAGRLSTTGSSLTSSSSVGDVMEEPRRFAQNSAQILALWEAKAPRSGLTWRRVWAWWPRRTLTSQAHAVVPESEVLGARAESSSLCVTVTLRAAEPVLVPWRPLIWIPFPQRAEFGLH